MPGRDRGCGNGSDKHAGFPAEAEQEADYVRKAWSIFVSVMHNMSGCSRSITASTRPPLAAARKPARFQVMMRRRLLRAALDHVVWGGACRG